MEDIKIKLKLSLEIMSRIKELKVFLKKNVFIDVIVYSINLVNLIEKTKRLHGGKGILCVKYPDGVLYKLKNEAH